MLGWLSLAAHVCADGSCQTQADGDGESQGQGIEEKGNKESKTKCDSHKSPRTLLQWAIGCEKEDENGQEHEEPLDADRPDFTEATTTVGLGRVQLETGYTYFRDT